MTHIFRQQFFALLAALIVFASCRSVKPGAPSLPKEDVAAPVPPPSQIDIPVQVDMKPFLDEIEKNVPAKINSTGYPNWENDANCLLRYKWNFWREKLTFTPNNNTLNIHCLGYYQGQGEARPCCYDFCPWVGAGCGINEPPRQIQLSIASSFTISPDYKIVTNTGVTKLNPINRCYVTSLNFDITNTIIPGARGPIDAACKEFDRSMLKFNLRQQVEKIWKILHEPIAIDTLGVLSFFPTGLRLSPLTTKGNTLYFSLGATASPRFSLTKDGLLKPPALPNLTNTSQKADGFSVNLETRLQYQQFTKLVNDQVKGMKFDFGKKHIVVQEVQLSGTGNRKLMIKVNFTGSTTGWIYLTGTPQFDTATSEIAIPDLDFDLETKNVLLKSAKWMFNNKITNTVRDNAKYSIADVLGQLKTEIEKNLNKNHGYGISTGGKVKKISISNIYPAADFLQVTALIQGNLDAKIEGVR